MRFLSLFLLFCVSFGLQTGAFAAARTLTVWPPSLELQRTGEQHELLPAWQEAGFPKALATGLLFVSDNPAVAEVSPGGTVTTRGVQGDQAFQVNLVRFINPAGLQSLGRNLYRETTASGQAEQGNAAQNGFGSFAQNYLEMSNVKVVEEMVGMIVAQRAYEVNSKAVQAADEMMGQANNLTR